MFPGKLLKMVLQYLVCQVDVLHLQVGRKDENHELDEGDHEDDREHESVPEDLREFFLQ